MEEILDDVVAPDELKKFEKEYYEQLSKNNVTTRAQFEYAWCLVRSKYPTDIRKGIQLLHELFTNHQDGKRDYLYYLAIGNARIKEYTTALSYIRAFLQIEPGNQQVLDLEQLIKKRVEKNGLVGMAVASGIAFAVGGIVVAGISLLKKSN